jgi:hypothetical protein
MARVWFAANSFSVQGVVMIPLTRALEILMTAAVIGFFAVVALAFIIGLCMRFSTRFQEWDKAEAARAGGAWQAPSQSWKPDKHDWAIIGVGILLVAAAVVSYRLPEDQRKTFIRVGGGTILIATLAGSLFAVKVRHLRSYATLELGFAVVLAAHTMWNLTDVIEPVQALGLLTAAYLIVRGLDNFKKDLDARRSQAEVNHPVAAIARASG